LEDINDISKLQDLLKETQGRGKKQRIQKKIDRLNGVEPIAKAKSGNDGDTGATVEHPKKNTA